MFKPSPLLQLRSISKRFPGVQALEDVSVTVDIGQIHAIVGENGAGKSTLLKALGGIQQPDQGQICIDGQQCGLRDVRDAIDLGIGLIHQELNLAGNLSVAENIFLGRQPSRGPRWLPITNRRSMHRLARCHLNSVGLDVSTHTNVGRLNLAQQQLVEIAKTLSMDARILVFDEPTSSLSLTEANRLLALIEDLRDQGMAILYVSHRLHEVVRLANNVTVLRDGKHVGTLTGNEISAGKMIGLMVGRDLEQYYHKVDHTTEEGEPALRVCNLRYPDAKEAINFYVQPGEIVGFAGLVGAGRSELARALFGIDPVQDGDVYIHGARQAIHHPAEAVAAGIALVPEDRKTCGLLLQMTASFNVGLASLPRLGRFGWYNRRGEFGLAEHFRRELDIRSASLDQKAICLSGGNQQKLVLAKWLAMRPQVLILDEPTRGVDVGAKSEIYRLVFELASRGMAVLIISSEMEEIVGVSDRVIVMHEGRIMGELRGDEISEPSIMYLAVGNSAIVGD